MQLEFDFEFPPIVKKLFFMTTGRFSDELCYTTNTSYGDASGYTESQAMNRLLILGYPKQKAKALLLRAKHSEKWIVYHYQQSLSF